MRRLFLSTLFIGFLITSCEKTTFEITEFQGDASFTEDVQPLFESGAYNCVGCHNGSPQPDLREGESYNSLIDGDFVTPGDTTSVLLEKLYTGHGTMNDFDISIIKKWIIDGAENN